MPMKVHGASQEGGPILYLSNEILVSRFFTFFRISTLAFGLIFDILAELLKDNVYLIIKSRSNSCKKERKFYKMKFCDYLCHSIYT